MAVKYSLQAFMMPTDNNSKEEPLGQKVSFIVKSQKLYTAEITKNIRLNHNICYCISHGYTHFKIELNKTHFRAKEMLTAKIMVDNGNTSKKINKVNVKIYRRLHIFKNDFQITKEIKEENFKGVEGSAKESYQLSVVLPIALPPTHHSEVCSLSFYVSVEAFFGEEKQIAENEFIVMPDESQMLNMDPEDDEDS
jgi:hypothetical protein